MRRFIGPLSYPLPLFVDALAKLSRASSLFSLAIEFVASRRSFPRTFLLFARFLANVCVGSSLLKEVTRRVSLSLSPLFRCNENTVELTDGEECEVNDNRGFRSTGGRYVIELDSRRLRLSFG